ncbi:RNA polymerase sigma-70 factor [Pedobacter sp. KBW06]|uniref:RNA polymerase sigma-70 factor n=1 Tax=Pedobacter sp. KBW06 TaxID=2153359 RepID=UPI001F23D0A5|nr:RNA polymerase sigma-70 factor [Pedobacter sp. KBW06]
MSTPVFKMDGHREDELIAALILGSESAFTEIYEHYWLKLLALAYSHTKNKQIAEGIVQDVFISIWNRKTSLKIHSLSNYFAIAVKFSVFKHKQREQRRREIEMENCKSDEFILDDEKIEARFLEEYFRGVVEQLPEKCKMVFNYSRIKGLSNPEIAREMNISEKTVEAHLTKAIKALRVSLKDAGFLLFF